MRFTPSFSAVLWDPPATAGVLSSLSYIVIVMNSSTGQVIVSDTTTNINYTLPVLQPCQYYTANVTAFSSQHHSVCVFTRQRTPGGESLNCVFHVKHLISQLYLHVPLLGSCCKGCWLVLLSNKYNCHFHRPMHDYFIYFIEELAAC